jgi:hypothetical protein
MIHRIYKENKINIGTVPKAFFGPTSGQKLLVLASFRASFLQVSTF